MNMTEEQILKAFKILNHYGEKKQRRQLVEECAELIQAVTKLERAQESDSIAKVIERTHDLASELADVRIMIEQIEMTISGDISTNIQEQIEYKLQRQLDRIEHERRRKNENSVN